MDTNTAEKFAGLFANCVVNSDAVALRKEAAVNGLTKESAGVTDWLMQNSPWLLPVAGTAAGAAAGYLGTSDEKRKKRNALYGALTGGLLGSGGALMGYGSGLAGDATDKMREANNEKNDAVNDTAPKGTWHRNANGKRTWLGAVAENTPVVEGLTMGGDHPFNPFNGVYGYNAYNIPARAVGIPLSGAVGGSVGSKFVDTPTKQKMFTEIDKAHKAPPPPKRQGNRNPPPVTPAWTLDEIKNVINNVNARANSPVMTWQDRLERIADGIPVPGIGRNRYTAAAMAEMGATPFTGWRPFLDNIANSVRNPRNAQAIWQNWSAARGATLENLRNAKELGRSARDTTLPTSPTGQQRLLTAVESVLTNPAAPNRAPAGVPAAPPPRLPPRPSVFGGAAPATTASQLPAPAPRTRMPSNTELQTAIRDVARSSGRGTRGRAAGRLAGGTAGLALSNPATVRSLLNYFLGSQLVKPPQDAPQNNAQ